MIDSAKTFRELGTEDVLGWPKISFGYLGESQMNFLANPTVDGIELAFKKERKITSTIFSKEYIAT